MSLWRRLRQICSSLRNPWEDPQNVGIYTNSHRIGAGANIDGIRSCACPNIDSSVSTANLTAKQAIISTTQRITAIRSAPGKGASKLAEMASTPAQTPQTGNTRSHPEHGRYAFQPRRYLGGSFLGK